MDRFVLLIGTRNYLIDRKKGKINTDLGIIDSKKIKKYGQKIKTKKGSFVVIKPTIIDFIKFSKRMPQVILPRDASSIVAETGLSYGWKCLDAGGGSGFLTMFISNIIGNKGKLYTYEKNKKFFDNIKKNIERAGLKNVVLKNEDVSKFKEKNIDLVTLDMMGAEKLVGKVFKRLNMGGWLVVYSPHIEQVKAVRNEMESVGFEFIKTIENMQRKWKVDDYTHPFPSGIIHTGFITFGRRVSK